MAEMRRSFAPKLFTCGRGFHTFFRGQLRRFSMHSDRRLMHLNLIRFFSGKKTEFPTNCETTRMHVNAMFPFVHDLNTIVRI
jgi:hypothetical protein